MDQLLALRAFCRVVERRNFSAVARDFGLKQSTVSRLVVELEQRVGVRLLTRTTRMVTPTEEGRSYYERVAPAIGELAEALQDIGEKSKQLAGSVRIAAPAAFGRRFVVPAVAEALRAHEQLKVEVLLSDLSVDLVAEGVDFAVRVAASASGTFSQRRLGEARQVIVASPSYLDRQGRPAGLADLPAHTFVLCTSTRTAMLELRASKQLPFAPESATRYLSDDIDSVAEMVREGVGIGVIPLWMVARELESGAIERLFPQYPIPAAPIVAVYSSGRQLSRRARYMLDEVAKRIGGDPSTR
jgi:DNA-binding transcriptional LysR family regulator